MGWNTVDGRRGLASCSPGSTPTRGSTSSTPTPCTRPDGLVTTAEHGEPFVAAVERGPVSATQFHPEKSGDAGAALLENWLHDRMSRS